MEEVENDYRRNASRRSPTASGARIRSEEVPKLAPGNLLPAMDDGTLLALVGQGDENAMGTLFDRYSRLVYSVSLRVLRDPSAAEDVLQEIFLQVWRKPEGMVVNRSTLGAWLAVAARNRSMDAFRRQKPSDSVEKLALPSGADVVGDAERQALMDRVRGSVRRMSADQRKTLELAFFDGLTDTEIADTTGDPLGTVKTGIRSALLQLRKAVTA